MDDAKSKGTKTGPAEAPVKGKGKKTKAPKEAPAAKETKPAPETKPRREKIPAQDVCVFAFRLSTKDRERIHEAAGGGKASGFVLAAALAAASGDVDAFRAVVASRAATR